MEVDYERVERARRAHAARGSSSLTYLPFAMRAMVLAARDYPLVNSHVLEDGLATFDRVHIGVAVDLDDQGLVVPVVRDADRLACTGLAAAIDALAQAARTSSLTTEHLDGGTITVTNPGRAATTLGAPVINVPQAAIVETDGIGLRVVADYVEGEVYIGARLRGNLSMSYDHRAFDGAYACGYLRQVCDLLSDRDWTGELGL